MIALLTGLIFVPAFLLFLIFTSLKFQFLEIRFWQTAYDDAFYQSLADGLERQVGRALAKEGARPREVQEVKDFLAAENLKSLAEGNLQNLLPFVSGQGEQLFIYLPSEKLPPGILPPSLGLSSDQVPVEKLLQLLGKDSPESKKFLEYSKKIGLTVGLFWIFLVFWLGLILFGLFKSTAPGQRFYSLTVVSIPAAITGLLFSGALTVIGYTWTAELAPRGETIGVVMPPLMLPVSRLWFFISAGLLTFGLLMFLLRKPKTSSGGATGKR